MARRHDALIPLSHDHHHTLAQARRLHQAAELDDDTERRNIANDFVNFFFGRAVRHFREEEELFFAPLVDHSEVSSLVLRAVADHLRAHSMVRTLSRQLSTGSVEGPLLGRIATLLTDHVRFEEQQLFPLVEQEISEAELSDLATAGRRDV